MKKFLLTLIASLSIVAMPVAAEAVDNSVEENESGIIIALTAVVSLLAIGILILGDSSEDEPISA